MAENLTVARPYAEAAFELAKAGGALSAWQDMLQQVAVVSTDERVIECITDPRISPEALAELLLGAATEASREQRNFINILVENRRSGVLTEVSQHFNELKNAQEDVRETVVSSAFPLDAAQLDNLLAELEHKFGCKLKATVKLAPELIGGVRIALGDQVIDASVRGKLSAMAASLKKPGVFS